MQTVMGIFRTREDACRAIERAHAAGVPKDRVSLLMPGASRREVDREVPTDEGEQPGMGAAVGGVLGGALGLSTAALVLPGVGPVIAAGLLAAGAAGAAGGAVVGDRLEDRLSGGLPRDELPIYEAALRRGRSVAAVSVETDEEAVRARRILAEAGAESVDPARDDRLVGLRGTGA